MVSIRPVARRRAAWWSMWCLVLAGGVALMAFLWRLDKKTPDRIALVAVAMSVIGIVVAAAAAKWTREAVVIADRSWWAQSLSEEMSRLETIAAAARECAAAARNSGYDGAEAAGRLAAALGPFTNKDLTHTFELEQKCRGGSTPDANVVGDALKEITDALEARRVKRAALIGQ